MKDKTLKTGLRIENNGGKIKTYPSCAIKHVKTFLSATVFVLLHVIVLPDVCISFDKRVKHQIRERVK